MNMKFYLSILMIFLYLSFCSSQNNFVTDMNFTIKQADTIKFISKWDFRGKCENNCVVYVGNNESVKTVNGIDNDDRYNYSLFIDCPTKYRLRKNKEYNFVVEEFYPDECTESTDSLVNTKRYKLIKMISE